MQLSLIFNTGTEPLLYSI